MLFYGWIQYVVNRNVAAAATMISPASVLNLMPALCPSPNPTNGSGAAPVKVGDAEISKH